MRILALKTLTAIDTAIVADGGAKFRSFQEKVLPHIADAYSQKEDGYRTHLGASVIGGKCTRAIYYAWRWALKKSPRGKKGEPAAKAESRMRRLWNRGHLEEGRFIAMLLSIGVEVYQQDANGNQYRISAFGGHFGGAGDGILKGVPDLPPGEPCLGEFKTHSDSSFTELVENGVSVAKWEHFVQMQEYMHHFGLRYALYLAVNKNTEELYGEIIVYDRAVAEQYLDRAKEIIYTTKIPDRMRGASPGFFVCKYMCDYKDVCYSTIQPDRNCRTCQHAFAMPDGTWQCTSPDVQLEAEKAGWDDVVTLSKEAQLAGCEHHRTSDALK